MNTDELQLLRSILEHFDGIADGAPDASYSAKMALQFHAPLKALSDRAEEELNLARSDRQWDETVTRLRGEGLIP